jgi:uncharacterized SAM-binding protein YcdF (DUF218 family)
MSDLTDERSVAAATRNGGGRLSTVASGSMRLRYFSRLSRRASIPLVVTFCAILLINGFVGFAERVAKARPPANPHADAIVVLTGGSARINGALNLLAEGRASRLLISGVNPSVTSHDLAGLIDAELSGSLECCVDLDREAADTIGNATETRLWAEERGFSSLIVVTSNYHMPRSMTELASAMPNVALIPFPVSNPALRISDWWRDPPTFALLVGEYGKYLFAKARRILPTTSRSTVNRAP